jgi:outer membrane protein TolC
MAETGLKIHELDRQSVENSLIASVIHAYYNTLAAQDFIQIAQESVATVETQLRVMEVRYQAGGVLRSDVLSLNVRLAQAREDLVRARNNHSLSLAALANLFGIDPDTPISLAGPEGVPLDVPEDYQQGLVYALASRAELKKVRQRIVQSRMGVEMARSEYWPSLDLQGKYYLDDPDLDFESERENWTAGIIMNWDLFTGLSTKARVNKAKRIVEEMLAADRKATLSVQLDLKTAYLKFSEAKARLAVTEASAAQAGESLRLVKRQYEGGSATITRYLDAELARNRARIRAAAAFYDREKALAALGRALGYWGKYAKEALSTHE